jgi:hypothetical protein
MQVVLVQVVTQIITLAAAQVAVVLAEKTQLVLVLTAQQTQAAAAVAADISAAQAQTAVQVVQV